MKTSLIVAGLGLSVGLAMAQNPQRSTTPQAGSSAQSQGQESTSAKTETKAGNTAEVKTQTFKGALVDASCAGAAAPATSSTKSGNTNAKSSSNSSVSKTGEASRTGENSQNCAASANTSQFGLRMKDGRVMRFDAVGNERAKEAFSARKKWSDASAAGKEIESTVSGTESGDQLTVISVH